jgi:hypothetical protein
MTMTTFISVTSIKSSARNTIARRFGVKVDWHTVSGKRRYVLSIPGSMATSEFVREVQAAVDAAAN